MCSSDLPPGLLDFLAEREVGGVEVPGLCPRVTFTFPDEQFYRNGSASQGQVGYRNGSASQGQVGVVDSGGWVSHSEVSLHLLEGPLERLDPEEPPVGL